MAGPR